MSEDYIKEMVPYERIAVYWDFENMHKSLQPQDYYTDKNDKHRSIKSEDRLDVHAIMDFINTIGEVNINKAYAN